MLPQALLAVENGAGQRQGSLQLVDLFFYRFHVDRGDQLSLAHVVPLLYGQAQHAAADFGDGRYHIFGGDGTLNGNEVFEIGRSDRLGRHERSAHGGGVFFQNGHLEGFDVLRQLAHLGLLYPQSFAHLGQGLVRGVVRFGTGAAQEEKK